MLCKSLQSLIFYMSSSKKWTEPEAERVQHPQKQDTHDMHGDNGQSVEEGPRGVQGTSCRFVFLPTHHTDTLIILRNILANVQEWWHMERLILFVFKI